MKKIFSILLISLFCFGCNGQLKKEDNKNADRDGTVQNPPEGEWKVNREYDENGNLIRYDSIYSWSSSDHLKKLGPMDRDSLLQAFRSRFSEHFSAFDHDGFPGLMAGDSLFEKRFFEDDFFASPLGRDFMDLEAVHKRMEEMQRKFLEQYGQIPEKSEDRDQG